MVRVRTLAPTRPVLGLCIVSKDLLGQMRRQLLPEALGWVGQVLPISVSRGGLGRDASCPGASGPPMGKQRPEARTSELVRGCLHGTAAPSPDMGLPPRGLNTSLLSCALSSILPSLLLPILLICLEGRTVGSVLKHCPLWGQATTPGKPFSSPGSRGSGLSVCLLIQTALSVSQAGCKPPGAWTLPAAGQSVLTHVPLASGRQERPPELASLLQRLRAEAASRSWSGSRVQISLGSVGGRPGQLA